MNIYVASRYKNRHEPRLKDLVKVLKSAGHKIVSSWLEDPETDTLSCAILSSHALGDKYDLDDADVVLVWHYDVKGATGGMFWEMGYAAGRNKSVMILNPENERITMIFALLPDIIHVTTVNETINALRRLEKIRKKEAEKYGKSVV